jgi:hypothetical protein
MSQIILTKSFQKQLVKFKSVSKKQIINEIKKHISGLNILVDIYSPAPNLKVLKGYLANNKVRIAILFIISREQYTPFFLARKESKQGWNISKQSEKSLENYIIKAIQDIENKDFEIIK